MKRIGIPRAFYYFHYPSLWETFFRELGMQPVVSGKTTRDILTRASSVTETEHCLPNKIFDGHVDSLKGQVDCIFIPRILSMVAGHIACPKFGALPEATQAGAAEGLEVISIDINETAVPLRTTLIRLARSLGARRRQAVAAADAALLAMSAAESKQQEHPVPGNTDNPLFLLLGHPYTLRDDFIATPIRRKLKQMGTEIEQISFVDRDFEPGEILWCTFRKMHDRLLLLDRERYAGVIQISTFNCGADSMMIERFRRLCARLDIPYMVIMVDEHTGRAGVDTRLEAFVESLEWRRNRSRTKDEKT